METSNALAGVLSVAALDQDKSQNRAEAQDSLINPDAPPPCFQHPLAMSSCVFRPCGHTVCAPCLGLALISGSKCSCGSPIAKSVGMKQPLPQLETKEDDDDNVLHWTVREIEQLSKDAAQFGRVVIIHRPEDKVAPLQQQQQEPVA